MLQQAYGDQCLSRTRCHEWFTRFKSGRMSVVDEPRSGCPSTSTDAEVMQVNEIVRVNRRLTVQEIAEECNISI
ncbi:hypothetical protein ANN_19313 [Periplaneta americana]|uniref:Mos1 transposase HTH domain-containing protein n=1 Tax=Periplaneta americana TaxID=6978 RepID=A0ABQ8S9I5_PERAM|nr:hypothetical protein ANN_19311 [Periplaneta americana]KAJ4430722.1 hypothetical protein ANN_19313 [Periplaneta americana]